jgi:hypothetical protein
MYSLFSKINALKSFQLRKLRRPRGGGLYM